MDNSPANQEEKNPPDILKLFEGAIKGDGSLDLRSTFGRSLRAIQEQLEEDEIETAKAMLKRDVSFFTIFQKVIESYLLANPEIIITEQGLSPLVMRDLVKIQEAKRHTLNRLLELKKKRSSGKRKGGRDLSAISFD